MFLFTDRNVLHLLAMATFLHICQGRSVASELSGANTTAGLLWQPKEGTRSEWMACRGMPKDVFERIEIKKQVLQKILAKKYGLDRVANEHQDSSPNDNNEGQCIMYTEEQLDVMIAEAKNEENATSTHRSKRALIKNYPERKWSMPISYKFDGTHDDEQRATIRRAFQHWADNTCIRFTELETNDPFNSSHILMTRNESDGCWSYAGRINQIPQRINLASWCIEKLGIILHEIGHSLGLVHEQQRIDRNDSIRIIWSNINQNSLLQYMERDTDALGLPYNYGSVMHYSSKTANGSDTMIALETLYQRNMGQIVDLSFQDRMIINLAYCQEICATPLSQPCQRDGYQNPNNCSTCICPGGFSGRYCNEIAPPKNANCGGLLIIVSGTEQVIKSPGYDETGYSEQQECTWWIKAPENYTLQLDFSGNFSIYCGYRSVCYHWVEIKYKKDLGLEGARFCCNSRPNDTVISESNEMMVIFRSDYSVGLQDNTSRLGFQAIVKSSNNSEPNGKLKSLFRCSFETTSSGNSLCGITQDKTDKFDWTVYHGPTPSFPTGPDFPYDGNFYIYIDARSPRKLNDEARLFFPRLNFTGEVCVNFYYHMFGLCVNSLKLVRITNSQRTDVWKRTGEVGNFWVKASVGVNLLSSSQLQFVGIRGNCFAGDIGLDKIEVTSGPCAL